FTPYIHVADIDSNSLVFIGTLDVYPETDFSLNITADNLSPSIGSKVNFTICVKNNIGGTPAVNIKILVSLSKNFSYLSNETFGNPSFYNSNISIWNISYLESGESACLRITTIVVLTSEATQLAMILDGSGSISTGDFYLMKEGLASSIENPSIFPHDGNVELTVIQFGGLQARVELGPSLVTKNNYTLIGSKIRSIHQIGSSTPMSCGIRLAADKLFNSKYFGVNKRQIVNLITDGVANCYWINGYTGTSQGYDGWVKGDDQVHTGNYSARAYYLNNNRNRDGNFYCNDVNTTGATSITVDFWYRLHYTEDGAWSGNGKNRHWTADDDLILYYYNGNSYDSIQNLGNGTEDTWLHYTNTITNTQYPKYFKQNFKIQLKSFCDSDEKVWIDDVIIKTNNKELLNDSFESEYWADKWWNPSLKSAEEASSYLINKLQMTNDRDQFDSLAVGVNGYYYTGPDVYWLKNKIVWPQPSYIAPPYIAGWVKTITTWQEFEQAIIEIFSGYFGVSNNNYVQIISSTPSIDPNPEDNEMSIILDTD
ncbi:MAG: VWA domain-containing protein, partial [Candidatus Thermoplasmatota archaeon]|nr:VWA domain-containing protein [Candidatus Thermoplasmatota archaeon]